MLEESSERSAADVERKAPDTIEVTAVDEVERPGRYRLFRLGLLIYGGVLSFMAVDGLRNPEQRVQFAKSKGIPKPELATDVAHGLLLVGGIGLSLWRLPTVAASAVVAFFAGVTPTMHDFWAVDDPEQKQQQMTDFLKNTALLGVALTLLAVARNRD